MGIEMRGGRAYYYRKVRRDGRVVSEYMGGGESAKLFAMLDTAGRDERETERQDWKHERGRLEEADRAIQEYCDRVEAIARATLILAGYRRHKRGEWRRRRERP